MPEWQSHSNMAVAAALLTAALLLPSVTGQGLAVPDASLGAGELATASEFERFEETLSLQLQTSGKGGRGGGNKGKGGSGSGSGGGVGESFKQLKTMEQLQLSMYYTAAAPALFETSKLAGATTMPRAVDQGDCSTCVGQAIATAMQMSVAKTLQQDVNQWAVNAPMLYYCTQGGRTCKTGWDIQEALNAVIDEAPELILPASCVDKNGYLSNTGEDASITQWAPICREAASAKNCSQYTRQMPWLTCSYESLSDFYQIQRHIRNHGAVISRLTVYSDFELFFNASARSAIGLEWPPYMYNKSAVPLFGHAALIVGYDNDNYTWTVLNSWGTADSTVNSRRGVTKDGTFRIAMGVAGVGVPDQTYGVQCIPTPGREPNLHGTQPWTKRSRKPVELIDPVRDKANLNASCYNYKVAAADTVASIVDHFGINLSQFVKVNQQLFGRPQNVTYKFQDSVISRVASDVTDVLSTSTTLSSSLQGASKPYFRCFFYDSAGKMAPVTCSLGSDVTPCIQPGTVGCSLFYQELNVTDVLKVGQNIRICGISKPEAPGAFEKVAYFEDVRITQYRALRAILNLLSYADVTLPNQYCNKKEYQDGKDGTGPYFADRWVTKCTDDKHVRALDLTIMNIGRDYKDSLPVLDASLTAALLSLEQLEKLTVVISGGNLPAEIGALSQMKYLSIRHYCADGPLPPNWILGWRNISLLRVTTYEEALGNSPDAIEQCGVTGNIPVQWGVRKRHLKILDLSYNRLSGRLPTSPLITLGSLAYIALNNNSFTGQVPYSWSGLPCSTNPTSDMCRWSLEIDLSGNKLSGPFPKSWQKLRYVIKSLNLAGNEGLTGCVPLTGYSMVKFSESRITGLCMGTRSDIEKQQADALLLWLPQILNARRDKSRQDQIDFALQPIRNLDWQQSEQQGLRGLIQDGLLARAFYGATQGRTAEYKITLTMIDTTAYFTAIESSGAGLDLSLLGNLLDKLPQLQKFDCDFCTDNYMTGNQRAHILPSDLPNRAPKSLTHFKITGSGLKGQIPNSLGVWTTLKLLDVDVNMLTGTIPSSMSGMKSLETWHMADNKLTGVLPESVGLAKLPLLDVNLSYNLLTGSIPASWAALSTANIELYGTNLTGCIPFGLDIFLQLQPCENGTLSDRQQVQALIALAAAFNVNASAKAWYVSKPFREEGTDALPPGPVTPPAYCRTWTGVTCDDSYNVIGVNLTALDIPNPPAQQPSAITPILLNLPFLQTLILSGLNLRGNLPVDLPTILPSLQHLDLSRNLQVSGSLPEDWAGFSKLQTLDLSGCSITGQLPELFAVLQELKVFRVVGSKAGGGLTGQLPASYGLLKSLVELDLSQNDLSGALPGVWVDPYRMASAAAATIARAKDVGAYVAAAAETSHNQLTDSQRPDLVKGATATGPTAGACTTTTCKQALHQYQRLSRAAAAWRHMANSLEASFATAQQATLTASRTSIPGQTDTMATTSAAVLGQQLHLEQLQVLRVRDNAKMSGVLPVGLVNLPALRVLDLGVTAGKGGINGSLPAQYSMFKSLQELSLSGQSLEGQLPPDWATLNKLTKLHLDKNNLSGGLSQLWASMTQLQEIDLSDNAISGELPGLWSAWKSMRLIDISNNRLSGTIPQRIFDMSGDAYQLSCFALYGNSISNIPEVVQRFAGTKVSVATSPAGSCN